MLRYLVILAAVLAVLLAVAVGIRAWRQRAQPVTLERQLQDLASCGVHLAEGWSEEDLLERFPRARLEREPHELLAFALGEEMEEEPWLCDRLWHFDTERIEDEGDYAFILRRLVAMSGGALPVEGIRDRVDWEEEETWIEFQVEGETRRWELTWDRDWVDPGFFERFEELLQEHAPQLRLGMLSTGGQDLLLALLRPEELACLRSRCGLEFET